MKLLNTIECNEMYTFTEFFVKNSWRQISKMKLSNTIECNEMYDFTEFFVKNSWRQI